MGLFTKKKEETETVPKGLPNPPELPSLPELPKTGDELIPPSRSDLPNSSPESSTGLPEIETSELPGEIGELPEVETKALPELNPEQNQNQIKTAISPPGMQKSIQPVKSFKQPDIPKTVEIASDNPPKSYQKPSTKKAEPIYIRLDKFETTVAVFEEIKTKIQEIEELLRKTKEIKQKEEQELLEWEREIQMIKSRIDTIDKNIFNKLD